MRKIIVSTRVTLDGFIAGPNGEMDWMEEFFDEALATYESELQKTVDTTLFGRVTYQGFESYWPKVALDPASPKSLSEYAQRYSLISRYRNDVVLPDIVGGGSRKKTGSTRRCAEPVFFSPISLSQETNVFKTAYFPEERDQHPHPRATMKALPTSSQPHSPLLYTIGPGRPIIEG